MTDRFYVNYEETGIIDAANDCKLDIYEIEKFLNNWNTFVLQVLDYCEAVGLSFEEMGVNSNLISEEY